MLSSACRLLAIRPLLTAACVLNQMCCVQRAHCALINRAPCSAPLLEQLHSARGSLSHAYSTESSKSAAEQQTASGPPTLIVFGGRGFVGSAVCKEALKTGLNVVAISPSGTPPPGSSSWAGAVTWVRGNALEPMTYQHVLPGAVGAVSCVGAFGSQDHMLKINGTANQVAVAAAKAAGIPRYAYISAQIPLIPGIQLLLDGYIRGKQQAEQAVLSEYPSAGVVLRPAVIYGDRVVSHNMTLPLGMVFAPLEQLMGKVPNRKQLASLPVLGAAMLPATSVEAVAKAVVAAATDDTVPGGIIDCWQIAEQYGS